MFPSFINKRNQREIDEITEYLAENDVSYDNPEATVVIRDGGKIVATGSVDGKILKYFFNDEAYTGQGLMIKIYNELLNHLFEAQIDDYYVFTKPKNKNIFTSLGLKTIFITGEVALFEGGFKSYDSWIASIKSKLDPNAKIRGSIVANCNPMTLGHKYLFEDSMKKVDELIIFIVEEDKSVFPTEDRYNIVKNEMAEYQNVKVFLGGPYIISSATFPTYFIKEKNSSLDIYTELDARIFSERIAADLDISYRFVGTEPIDEVTKRYNEIMSKYINREGLSLQVLDRLEMNENVVSATRVRSLIKENKLEEAEQYVPKSTIDYLNSEKGKNTIQKIQNS